MALSFGSCSQTIFIFDSSCQEMFFKRGPLFDYFRPFRNIMTNIVQNCTIQKHRWRSWDSNLWPQYVSAEKSTELRRPPLPVAFCSAKFFYLFLLPRPQLIWSGSRFLQMSTLTDAFWTTQSKVLGNAWMLCSLLL